MATLLSVYLHLSLLTHAGSLWRDEINTINLANFPTLLEVWRHIEFDSTPVVSLLIVRGWSLIALNNDFLLRCLGFAVGIGILASLWYNARVFKTSYPLLSLALLGFSPSIIRWGDSLRGYGFGILSILLTFGLVWRMVESPTRNNTILAAVTALIAVQSLYYNAVLILAICVGGMTVLARRREWKQMVRVLAIGGICALSLVPYSAGFERARSLLPMYQVPQLWRGFQINWFWTKLCEAVNLPGFSLIWVWLCLFVVAVGFGISCLFLAKSVNADRGRCDVVIYCSTALVVGLVAYHLFLRRLQYLTQPWYYLALMAFTAAALDALFSAIVRQPIWRLVRLVAVAGMIALTFSPVRSILQTRMTNFDVTAAWLGQHAAADDLIIVNPWHCGISFAHYYRGEAAWLTIPPMDDYRIARIDLLLKHMTTPDQTRPIQPIVERVEETLKRGHRVWMAGDLPSANPGQEPPRLPPAPQSRWGWYCGPYQETWALQVMHFLQTHALRLQIVPLDTKTPVNPYENAKLIVVEGWQSAHQ